MLPIAPARDQVKCILLLGAHCDDIEIGCGGTALRLAEWYPDAAIVWVVLSSDAVREREARAAAGLFLAGVRDASIEVKNFRNGFFPFVGADIKAYFEQLKARLSPDLVFTHYRDDLHQDHRVVGELTWNTFRNHMILEYEIPKYDGGLGSPNCFVPLDASLRDRKVDHIMACFESQRDKQWFTPDTFGGLMRLRGIECNTPGGYAEAFYCRKTVFGPGA